ncbi:transcription termination factor Rho [Antrihabitans sp. YC2-6]|uniref:transcription termination factor Rho n=1 Tax=Antrihabitans sp. YC2-6 TaxID=2799498 RepID=UPI0018F66551|nr:transcription termination factor Rho [Antrihabitans sp. YC2-6]MBJ8348198.1 transcription termination factor Rho [Antrihabitans sp. YC2-6]
MTDTDLFTTPVADSGTDSPVSQASESQTSHTTPAARSAEAPRGGGLAGMLLPQLRALAAELGIRGTSGMRKGDLIGAINDRQTSSAPAKAPAAKGAVVEAAPKTEAPKADAPAADTAGDAGERTETDRGRDQQGGGRNRQRRGASRQAGSPEQGESTNGTEPAADSRQAEATRTEEETAKPDQAGDRPAQENQGGDRGRRERGNQGERNQGERNQGERNQGERNQGGNQQGERTQGGDRNQGDRNQNRNQNNNQAGNNGPRNDNRNNDNRDDDEDGRGGRRGRRFRERRRGRDRGEAGPGDTGREPEIREDDVLQPVAGILDVLDNYAFVRTSGYLAGPNDVYVSMNLVRKNGLRRGDAITGAVRAAREGEQNNQRQKFDPLVRLDTVNGGEVDAAKRRPEFQKLTPLYPNQRLRLETQQNKLTTRVIDLIMPIGKGQRALIVSPPKAGKTTIMQDIANAIAINNPECYLMVVLVDERPEEVTDMQRSVKGEVIASTFDRPPSDHTSVAELAIERAKRLVEMGKDVVVLLDSITRLGRAYNNSSPASGRILSGGVDSTALYPPKRFLGAARNIENGGSLTIIATAMVETGSTGDTVIFEEFKGTGNAELKLDRKIAERRVFPAVDINPSGTRKDELLMSPDEAAVLHKLRRVLSGLDSHQAIDLVIDRLKKSRNNLEFLMQVSKTAPGAAGED